MATTDTPTRETLRRREARQDELERATVTLSEATMAGIRLRAALDAAMRDGLSAGDLMAFAGRVVSASTTEADAALLAALDVDDLASVGMGAGTFIVSFVAVFRTVAAVMRATPGGTDEPIVRAVAAIQETAATLRQHMRVLPNADELEAIGGRVTYGTQTPADLALIRALPGPYLRAHTTGEHWSLFVDYRLHDE